MVAASLRELRKSYGRVRALDGLDLEVGSGEVLGLIGPSGAGKTSAAKALVGLIKPDSGEARVFGEAMPSREVLSRVGYMAQSDALFEDLDARGNLAYFAALQGMAPPRAAARAAELLELMDLAGDSRRPVRGFSGGMRKRLSLAIALIHRPGLAVLDEPTVGMDPRLRLRFWEEFRRIADGGAAVVATTHVMDEAERCDRLALVFEGRVIASGSPDGLRHDFGVRSLEEIFLAAPGPSVRAAPGGGR
jgi:ABC-2 type transport system ATP-binding protein